MRCFSHLDSAHMFFSYVDISRFGRISEVNDQFGNITFKFELEVNKDSIKGCGIDRKKDVREEEARRTYTRKKQECPTGMRANSRCEILSMHPMNTQGH